MLLWDGSQFVLLPVSSRNPWRLFQEWNLFNQILNWKFYLLRKYRDWAKFKKLGRWSDERFHYLQIQVYLIPEIDMQVDYWGFHYFNFCLYKFTLKNSSTESVNRNLLFARTDYIMNTINFFIALSLPLAWCELEYTLIDNTIAIITLLICNINISIGRKYMPCQSSIFQLS